MRTAGPDQNIAATNLAVDQDTIVLVEKAASGDDMQELADSIAADPQVEVQGEFFFLVNKNFSTGDEITIGGETFTAVAEADDITDAGKQFVAGGDSATTATNIMNAINANTTLKDRFAASVDEGNQGFNRECYKGNRR